MQAFSPFRPRGQRPMPRRRADHPCGTYNAYQLHIRRGEVSCEPCREANRVYNNELRATKDQRAQEAARAVRRNKALLRLAQEYPTRFREILVEEMKGLVSLPPEDEETDDEM